MSAAKQPRPVPPPAEGARATAPRDVYSRFIPREELSSFAAWHPGDGTPRKGQILRRAGR